MGGGWTSALSPSRPPAPPSTPQLLQSFEDIPLCSVLQQIQEKHDLQKAKKVRASGFRSAAPEWGYSGPFYLSLKSFFRP